MFFLIRISRIQLTSYGATCPIQENKKLHDEYSSYKLLATIFPSDGKVSDFVVPHRSAITDSTRHIFVLFFATTSPADTLPRQTTVITDICNFAQTGPKCTMICSFLYPSHVPTYQSPDSPKGSNFTT